MLLLARPPYLRWLLAGVLVIGALLWELSDRATVPYPFAAVSIAPGTPISDQVVVWRQVAQGTFERPDLVGTSAKTEIRQGDPLTRSVLATGDAVPEGWWSVPVQIPLGIARGTEVRMTLLDGSSVLGIVSTPASEDDFGVRMAGTVAVPEDQVDRVALASATDSMVVVVAP